MFTRFIFENEIVFALLKSDRLVSTPWFRVSGSLRNCCGRKGKKKPAHRLVSSPERVQLQMLCGNSLAFSFQKKTVDVSLLGIICTSFVFNKSVLEKIKQSEMNPS